MEAYKHINVASYVHAYYLAQADDEQLQRDIDFFKAYIPLKKVYLENHRGVVDITPQRLREIRAAVDVPLVLHGGSGLSDDDFRNTVRDGIAKINIFTDMCVAGSQASAQALAEGKDYLEMRNARVAAIKETVMNKMRLFGSVGKA